MLGQIMRHAQAFLGSVAALFAFLASDVERSANASGSAAVSSQAKPSDGTARR